MLIFDKIHDLKSYISLKRKDGLSIGFVPTMGALHEGHISLINTCRKQNNITICSIFVNPTQFNNPSDLKHYPRTPEKDIDLLEKNACDVLYMPEVNDVYTANNNLVFSFGYLDEILEAEHRPGHFNGVGQVVSILLENILPDKAYFGSKDYQQLMVVKDLVKQLQLNIEIISCPILREQDGLAMSSRNTRLTKEERAIAAFIPIMMKQAIAIINGKGINEAKKFITTEVNKHPLMKLDYYEVCNADTLELLDTIPSKQRCISLIAVFVGKIRLIDNWLV